MNAPESTTTVRSRGSISSSAIVSVRGSSQSRLSSYGWSRHVPAAISAASLMLRRPSASGSRGSFSSTSTSAWAVCWASATIPKSTGRWAPIASTSVSTWMTVASGPINAPWRVVHTFRDAPKAITTSASAISRCAIGVAKPPLIPRLNGSPVNRPLPTADVASSAPVSSPSRCSAGPAVERTAPRPPMITGRCARCRARATRRTSGRTSVISGAGGGGVSSTEAACTSSGRFKTTARRSTSARRTARAVSATAVAGECTRSDTAPTAVTSASWSILKFERSCAAGVSAASSSTGVRLLAASVSPVIAFVSPGPW